MKRIAFLKIFLVLCTINFTGFGCFADDEVSTEVNNGISMRQSIIENNKLLEESEKIAWELFQNVWADLTNRFTEKRITLPQQIVFLNGAPGAGKGTNTLAVMRELEIPSKPIEVSSLLNTPECEEIKKQGLLVGDDIVVAKVMKELLKPENARGIIIDGYPRTIVQAYFLKFLIGKLQETESGNRTVFRLINFSVSRATSTERQLARGRAALEQNENSSDPISVRETDLSIEAAERRYNIYESSIGRCITLLKDDLEYYEIKADGTFEEVKNKIHEVLNR